MRYTRAERCDRRDRLIRNLEGRPPPTPDAPHAGTRIGPKKDETNPDLRYARDGLALVAQLRAELHSRLDEDVSFQPGPQEPRPFQ